MTCVLSRTALYSLEGYDLPNKHSEDLDLNWIISDFRQPGLNESPRCATPCRIEACGRTEGCCGASLPKNARSDAHPDSSFKDREPLPVRQDTERAIIHEFEEKIKEDRFDPCKTVVSDVGSDMDVGNNISTQVKDQTTLSNNDAGRGIKRKAAFCESENPVPSKRISPFLNTPKEKKDERKKILKISIKKLKYIEDPETFLRRTVLLNNTMKRLQREVREDKIRSKRYRKNRSVYKHGVLNNNCLSNSYLLEDHFLSAAQEKITDDMTDTLVNNVLNYKAIDDYRDKADSETKMCDDNDAVVTQNSAMELDNDANNISAVDNDQKSLQDISVDVHNNNCVSTYPHKECSSGTVTNNLEPMCTCLSQSNSSAKFGSEIIPAHGEVDITCKNPAISTSERSTCALTHG